jgi:hypothetical protein
MVLSTWRNPYRVPGIVIDRLHGSDAGHVSCYLALRVPCIIVLLACDILLFEFDSRIFFCFTFSAWTVVSFLGWAWLAVF